MNTLILQTHAYLTNKDLLIMHILIFEVNLNGHHSVYLEKIAEAYLKSGCKVTVVVSEKYKDDAVLISLTKNFAEIFEIVFMERVDCLSAMNFKFGDVGREIGLWKLFRKIFKIICAKKTIDYIFLPYADYCLNAIGLLGSPFGKTSWGGICMRPTFHFKSCGVVAPSPAILHIKKLLFMRVLSINTLRKMFSIDELLAGYIQEHYSKLADKLIYLPDPVEPSKNFDNVELRQRYNIPEKVKLILVYGAIDERKGIFNLLDALELSPVLGDWHALIVGRQSTSVHCELLTDRWVNLKQTSRIHVIDDFVTDEVEHHVFAMCDVVWVAYVGHYTMSGVVVRAGMYCKPVIACKEGLIGWYARVRGVGVICSNASSELPDTILTFSNILISEKMGHYGFRQFEKNSWNNALALIL